jgi:hypothetical protein
MRSEPKTEVTNVSNRPRLMRRQNDQQGHGKQYQQGLGDVWMTGLMIVSQIKPQGLRYTLRYAASAY